MDNIGKQFIEFMNNEKIPGDGYNRELNGFSISYDDEEAVPYIEIFGPFNSTMTKMIKDQLKMVPGPEDSYASMEGEQLIIAYANERENFQRIEFSNSERFNSIGMKSIINIIRIEPRFPSEEFYHLMDIKKVFSKGYEPGRRLRGFHFYYNEEESYTGFVVKGHFGLELTKKIAETFDIPYNEGIEYDYSRAIKGQGALAYADVDGFYEVHPYNNEAVATLIDLIREANITNDWAFGSE